MNYSLSMPIDSDFHPLPAVIYGNHAIVLIPRGDKWEVRTIYISPVCLAQLFSCAAEAFTQGKKEADADT
ncbi:MAG: hypothetical protein F6K28_38315 [Microcoleus sp. SIO2G3]|nr:hypothetical protein [Microcoleus sp. SIO2G3]